MAAQCPNKKQKEKPADVNLFTRTNIPYIEEEDTRSDDSLVLVLEQSTEDIPEEMEIVKVFHSMNGEDKKALVDSGNPTTLVGLSWINEFIDAMDESTKKKVKREKSSRVFKFGDGKKRSQRVS